VQRVQYKAKGLVFSMSINGSDFKYGEPTNGGVSASQRGKAQGAVMSMEEKTTEFLPGGRIEEKKY